MKPVEHLIQFIKSNDNWNELLSKKPYSLRIKQIPDTNMWMFSYHMIETDFSLPETLAARGIILQIGDTLVGREVKVVCHAFDKFFNYGEPHASQIDWESATLLEKVDGSLLKYYWNPLEKKMCWASNNFYNLSFDLPGKDFVGCPYSTFQELVDSIIAKKQLRFLEPNKSFFGKECLGDYTFYFELISPWNRIVVPYQQEDLILLGARNNETHEEITASVAKDRFSIPCEVPKQFEVKNASYEEVQKIVSAFDATQEGIVVLDKNFNRVKIKGSAYLSLHRLKGTTGLLERFEVWNCIINNTVDDLLANFSEYASSINKLLDEYRFVLGTIREIHDKYKQDIPSELTKETRKEFALKINANKKAKAISSLLFGLLKDSPQTVYTYVKNLSLDKFDQILKEFK